jgi:hypothetical protein
MQKTELPEKYRAIVHFYTLAKNPETGSIAATRADGARFEGLDPSGPCGVCHDDEPGELLLALYRDEPVMACGSCCAGGPGA